MRYETRTERIGELLGPVDWSYDFFAGGSQHECQGKTKWSEQALERFRLIAADPDKYEVTTDGGWPRFGWGRVISVGMYDGWPYWRPVPSFMSSGPLGGEWHSWSCITDIRLLPVGVAGRDEPESKPEETT